MSISKMLFYMNIQNIGYPDTTKGILAGDYVYKASNSTPSTANSAVYGKLDYYDSVKNYLNCLSGYV